MIKKTLLVLLCVGIFASISVMSVINYYTLDTKCAQRFAEALNSCDIEKMDDYLDENASLVFKSYKDTYANCRTNVMNAYEKSRHIGVQVASYGYGNNKFEVGRQNISIKLMGKFGDIYIGECMINATMRREGLFGYKVESLSCDEEVYGYIFFGVLD